jgi:alkylhydroperoxidase/carboxymuconolactone decarboxylase family protein YurZ
MNELDADRARIKSYFIAERGYWRPWAETLLQADPGFLERYARYAGYPARSGPLSERMIELIYVALDASAAHLYEAGLGTHLARAVTAGASEADIFDTLHLVAAQGLESVYQAVAILADETGRLDHHSLDPVLQHRVAQVCPDLSEVLTLIATQDPGYAEVLIDFLAHRSSGNGLTLAERGLVQIALQACFTAFNSQAVRRLVRSTLAEGASSSEMLQAIQLGAHLSVHGTALGATVFTDIMNR